MKAQIWVGVAAVLALSAAASAAVAWAVPAGSQSGFSYDNGQTNSGLFGNGVSTPSGFFSTPANFVAVASGASPSQSTTDTTSVVVHTNGPLVAVEVVLLGDYSIFGTGDVNATGLITVTNLDTSVAYTSPISFAPPVSTTTSADGGFSGLGLAPVDLPGPNMRIDVSTTLTANAGSNGVSLIQLKDADIRLYLFPEPASLTALAGGLALLRRSRR